MGEVAKLIGLGGDDGSSALAAAQSAASERTALAQMAQSNAQADAQKVNPGGKASGRNLLTFLGAQGQTSLGAV